MAQVAHMTKKTPIVQKLDIPTALNLLASSTRRLKATQQTITTNVKGWGVKIDVTKTDVRIEQIEDKSDERC
jgi:hypothetical protein